MRIPVMQMTFARFRVPGCWARLHAGRCVRLAARHRSVLVAGAGVLAACGAWAPASAASARPLTAPVTVTFSFIGATAQKAVVPAGVTIGGAGWVGGGGGGFGGGGGGGGGAGSSHYTSALEDAQVARGGTSKVNGEIVISWVSALSRF
jgi:hypothetical protein